MKNKNNAWALLTAAAANLSSTSVQAAEVAENFQFGFRHHIYDEEPLKNALGGTADRYDIDVNQFSLIAPLSEQFELGVTYQQEKMSGASPWYTLQLGDGEPLQVMSGASIYDERKDASAKLRFVDGAASYAVTAAVSDEDDYRSNSFAFEYSRESEDKLTTWSFAGDFSNDKINAVDADIYLSRPADEQSKHTASGLVSYSRVLNKNTLVNVGVGMGKKSGFLSDPYKMVLVNFELIGDARPDSRLSKTLSARLRYFVDSTNSALHVDYRFYSDDWDIRSHTFDVSWYQNLPYDIQLVPSFRQYSQTSSFFYDVFYQDARSDGYYSTDYRLSEYGATTLGLKLIQHYEKFSVTLSAEKYDSGGNVGFSDAVNDNPGLVDFKLFSVGFDFRF
jgi:hypothetical protein